MVLIPAGGTRSTFPTGLAEALCKLEPEMLASWLVYQTSFREPKWPRDFTTADTFATPFSLRQDVRAMRARQWSISVPMPSDDPIPELLEVGRLRCLHAEERNRL